MTSWQDIAPKRARNAIHALGLFAKTGGKRYSYGDTEAKELIEQIDKALDEVKTAYDLPPLLVMTQPESPPVPKPGAVVQLHPLPKAPHIHQIADFVGRLRPEHLPAWITHLVNRICERREGGA